MAGELKRFTREDFLTTLVGEQPRSFIADHFAKYTYTPRLARFLMRYELMKMIVNVPGTIIECGAKTGDGLLQWWHLNQLLEPNNWHREIFGFDTFAGFPSVHEKDGDHEVGEQKFSSPGEIYQSLKMQMNWHAHITHDDHNVFEPVNWKPAIPSEQRMFLVAGDFMTTGPVFREEAKHLVVALLHLDFDLYEPTRLALELFMPRMPRGAVIIFDEINDKDWPGETLAVVESVGIDTLELRRFPWIDSPCYAVIR